MKRNAEDRIYGGSTVGERRKVIDDIKEGMADMPAFDEQAKMESDYIKDRGSHFGHREDDPKGMLDVNKELTQFKKLSKAGWEGTDSVDLSGNLRKLLFSSIGRNLSLHSKAVDSLKFRLNSSSPKLEIQKAISHLSEMQLKITTSTKNSQHKHQRHCTALKVRLWPTTPQCSSTGLTEDQTRPLRTPLSSAGMI